MKKIEFENFIKEMEIEFNRNNKRHGNSWKTTSLYVLKDLLKNHVKKFNNNFLDYFSNIKTDKKRKKLQNDLLDIANYCLILFKRFETK